MTIGGLIDESHVVICCGTGGVGKTTTSAVIALAAARRGRDAVVLTIDPAKRLADTLGLVELGDTVCEVDRSRWDPARSAPTTGRLSALMLDSRATFDALVRKHARTTEQAERILANRFYRNIAGALSGTQEYMAMEKLHELHEEGGFDLLVVDTPPTRHALEFLDAPARLTRLLDNRIFRFLMAPRRRSVRAASFAVQAFLRAVSRVIGSEAVDDVVAFFRAFEGMEQGFRERADSVLALLERPDTRFVLVTSPRRDAVDEAEYFARRLRDSRLEVAALVVNRVHPDFGVDVRPGELRRRATELSAQDGAPAERLAARYENLAQYASLSRRERDELTDAARRIGARVVTFVPSLPHDVVDMGTLQSVSTHLLG